MSALADLMRAQLPAGGILVPGGSEPHMEVIEAATGQVWMSLEPATRQDYEALLPQLDESLQPIGIGAAAMDAALFQHSPGGPDKPVRERTIGGHRFINVAIPGQRSSLPGGMMEMMVEKAHVIGFEAGRRLAVLRLPDGDFVEVVGSADQDDAIVLPEGGTLLRLELMAPWVVPLPEPTRTLWSFERGLRSFQGPVILPSA